MHFTMATHLDDQHLALHHWWTSNASIIRQGSWYIMIASRIYIILEIATKQKHQTHLIFSFSNFTIHVNSKIFFSRFTHLQIAIYSLNQSLRHIRELPKVGEPKSKWKIFVLILQASRFWMNSNLLIFMFCFLDCIASKGSSKQGSRLLRP
jgi:hypothetical protein